MFGGLISCVVVARYHRGLIRLTGRLLARLNVKASTRVRWARKLLHFLAAFTDTLKLPFQTLITVFALTCLHWVCVTACCTWHCAGSARTCSGPGVF
jgi:uncharacterized membrane protein YbhN (UPF0104 family)